MEPEKHENRGYNNRQYLLHLQNRFRSQGWYLILPPFRALCKTTIENSLQMEKCSKNAPTHPKKYFFDSMFLGVVFHQRHDARTQNARKLGFPLEKCSQKSQGVLDFASISCPL